MWYGRMQFTATEEKNNNNNNNEGPQAMFYCLYTQWLNIHMGNVKRVKIFYIYISKIPLISTCGDMRRPPCTRKGHSSQVI